MTSEYTCKTWKTMLFQLLLAITLPTTKSRPRYPLPAQARVYVDGGYNDIPGDSTDHSLCDGFKTTSQQVRRLFNTNVEVDGRERHNGVDEVACGIAGRIVLHNKTFHWQLIQSDPAGFVETDYPDGSNHMLAHRLGDLSDNPRPHRPSHTVNTNFWMK